MCYMLQGFNLIDQLYLWDLLLYAILQVLVSVWNDPRMFVVTVQILLADFP